MLKGIDLVSLAQKITDQAGQKKDFIATTADLRMNVEGGAAVLQHPSIGSLPIRPIAHDHIGLKAGIPARYYDRMLTEAPELLAASVNRWFRDDGDKRMVRTLAGDVRAFLSDRYARIENEEIAA